MSSRVQIKYEIEENNATVEKSLPFSIGVLADFCGNNSPYLKIPFEKREFLKINTQNIPESMKIFQPALKFSVKNTINSGENLNVDLTFKSMDDFEAIKIIEQIPELKKLLTLRNRLQELQTESLHNFDAFSCFKQSLIEYLGDAS